VKNVTMNDRIPRPFPGHRSCRACCNEGDGAGGGVLLLKIIKAENQVAYFMAADT